MSLKYYLIERQDMRPGANMGDKLVYGQVKCCDTVDFDMVCSMIEHSCTVTGADVKSVISSLIEVLKTQLSMGHIVDLSELGRFRMTVGCRGVNMDKEFNTSMFKAPKICFVPNVKLKRALSKMTYDRMTVPKPIGGGSGSTAGTGSGTGSTAGGGANPGDGIE